MQAGIAPSLPPWRSSLPAPPPISIRGLWVGRPAVSDTPLTQIRFPPAPAPSDLRPPRTRRQTAHRSVNQTDAG